ncbi:MAG: hypothetical protein J1E38_00680 [Paramuribaculum sp.]|nr:hypothetical protein [Paramuribaculum sp.]
MALRDCPECGKMISDKAERCPHCGVDPREATEKVTPERKPVEATTAYSSKGTNDSRSGGKKKLCLILVPLILIGVGVAIWVPVYQHKKAEAEEQARLEQIRQDSIAAVEAELARLEQLRQDSIAKEEKRKALMTDIYNKMAPVISAAKKKEGSWGAYFTTDLDEDGIPELWVKTGTCNADAIWSIYIFNEGQLKKIKEIAYAFDSVLYKDAKGIIEMFAKQGYTIWTLYTLADGNMKWKKIFEENLYETGRGDYPTPKCPKVREFKLNNLEPLKKELGI